MAIYYIGSFPPSYGGVTIKNKNLCAYLRRDLDIRTIDMNRIKRRDLREMVRFCWAMAVGRQYVIGLAGQKNRRQFTKMMYRIKRRAMKRSVMLVMSGVVEDIIQAGPGYMEKLSNYRRIYLEFPGMARKLTEAGVTNADTYPNGRPRPDAFEPIRDNREALRCVFFSQIQPEKGVDRILEAAKELPEMQFDFYGGIVPEYRDAFLNEVEKLQNVRYYGVFSGNSEEVYAELARYDALLLPTRCATEGLPGILIEAKIAGIPSVISGINYNREVVTDGVDGIVLEADSADCLKAALMKLDEDRDALLRMKQASRDSAEQYYIDVCARDVLAQLREG